MLVTAEILGCGISRGSPITVLVTALTFHLTFFSRWISRSGKCKTAPLAGSLILTAD